MNELKREHIKYIRDYIKKDYKTRECCYICGSEQLLELHHLYCLSELFAEWCTINKVQNISTATEIKEHRVKFAADYAEQLHNDNLYTLCKPHHMMLHSVYGKSYPSSYVQKVKNWLEVLKDKHGNK